MTDATARSRLDATHRHLYALAADLNQDEMEVAIEVVDGLIKGRDVYGPMNLDGDRRDLDAEAREEQRDLLVYRAMRAIQRRRVERTALHEAAAEELGAIDTWGKVIVRSPHARAVETGPVQCECDRCWLFRADAALSWPPTEIDEIDERTFSREHLGEFAALATPMPCGCAWGAHEPTANHDPDVDAGPRCPLGWPVGIG